MLETVGRLDCDLLSLVELDDYEEFFEPRLAAMGYAGRWHKRPRPSSLDGCGVFWRQSMFELIASDSVDFVDSVDEDSGTEHKEPLCAGCERRFAHGPR